ncbi:hypothetical protein CC86DRAFT_13602 [Ophiobolus disseminans]|uniref:Uncharacterized protein n=1 Tax=Ophiobolus disseminans TaxID=1469910 RepID=A0A6A7AL29_9PLEO|nr:hypothetical protein CC86DRAFT_13602 [Ophiobolus disseminans]
MTSPSPQARLTLLSAFERFAATVTPDDQRVFNNTKLKDVRDEAISIERQLRARRTQRNMARLEPFLRDAEHYSKVVEVLCNGTPYLSWVWAPVKLMLMITADSIGAFEKLIEAYGKIADMMPRLDRFASALLDDFNFQIVLALVYSDIVEFHRRAYKFVRRKSWQILFGSLWAGFEVRFNSILRSLAYHSELVDKEAVAADISDAVRRYKEESEKWEQQEREWEATKIRTVLSWLETSGTIPADAVEQLIHDCLPNSCDWFIQHYQTQSWLDDSGNNALLWLCGKPGAGKSTICSSLVRHAETNSINVFYYFCSYLGNSTEGPSRLLRSLISQILQKHQDLVTYVHDVYFRSHPVPTKKALLQLLPELLRSLGSVRLIVDGIDEWEPRDQSDLLKDLTQIISTDRSAYICKVMIASRTTLEISRILHRKSRPAVIVSLSESDEGLALSHSIGQLVDDKLSDLPDHFTDLDPESLIVAQIKQALLEKSNGMFLWVRLVLNLLDAVYSPEELRAIVDDLPSDLETLYGRILARLYSVNGAHSHGGVSRIISWICFAQRPLHKYELLHALSVPRYGTGSDAQSVPIPSILDHCKPFIEERSDTTMVFVHFSVKEFFLKSTMPQIVPEVQAQLDLASVCVINLIRGLELLGADDSLADLVRIVRGGYRLLPYALDFWIEHCSLYATQEGFLGVVNPLARHLTRLHNTHENLAKKLKHLGNIRATAEPRNNEFCTQLEPFAHMPVFQTMTGVLHVRRIIARRDCESGKDAEAFAIQHDQTLFSILASRFENAIGDLLVRQEVLDIPNAALRAFQESYASTAFRCRYPNCHRSSMGFTSKQLRTQHEAVHFQRVYCNISTCQFNRIGFAKRATLNTHSRTHHSAETTVPIPSQVRQPKTEISRDFDVNFPPKTHQDRGKASTPPDVPSPSKTPQDSLLPLPIPTPGGYSLPQDFSLSEHLDFDPTTATPDLDTQPYPSDMYADPLAANKHFDPQFYPPFGRPRKTPSPRPPSPPLPSSPPPRPPSSLPRRKSDDGRFTDEQMDAMRRGQRLRNYGGYNYPRPVNIDLSPAEKE